MTKVTNKVFVSSLFLILATLLAACGGDARAQLTQPSPIPTEPATATPTVAPTTTPTFTPTPPPIDTPTVTLIATATPVPPTFTPTPTPLDPLTIDWMRQQEYPGSEITFEESLEPGSNYDRYLASYLSEGSKIYALLTVPTGEKPSDGWPVIVFNHGYIPPGQYRTTERYVDYVDALARNGYRWKLFHETLFNKVNCSDHAMGQCTQLVQSWAGLGRNTRNIE